MEPLLCKFRGIVGVAPQPLGEVRLAAPAIDIIDDKPRYRRHVAVPWPARQIRVAVGTGALQYAFDPRGHEHYGFQSMRFIYGRIGARGSNHLDADDQTEKSKQCASQEFRQLDWLPIAPCWSSLTDYAFISLGRTASARTAPTAHSSDI